MDGKSAEKKNSKNNHSVNVSRVMLMLYELEVLQSDCERIGDPVALPLTDIVNSNTNSNRLSQLIKFRLLLMILFFRNNR